MDAFAWEFAFGFLKDFEIATQALEIAMNSLYIFQYWNDSKPYEAGGFCGKIVGQLSTMVYGSVMFVLKFIPEECAEGEDCNEEKD
jgi:hypothetical protein